MKISILCLLILALFSCKKKEENSFLIGKWKSTALSFNRTGLEVTSSFTALGRLQCPAVEMEITATHIIFKSDEGTVKFKILSVTEVIADDDYEYHEGEKIYGGVTNNYYKFVLKKKDGNEFEFTYAVNKENRIFGNFWIKGQKHFKKEMPSYVVAYIYNSLDGYSTGPYKKELYIMYDKIN